jgi:hypothetical protein
MTPRQIRRAEERRARKSGDAQPTPTAETKSAKPLFTEAKLEANRANAQLSTGPRTADGRAISARNNFRHGFTGAFCVLPDEDAAAFAQFADDLEAEHEPATPTEVLLVAGMARHHWLTQRALRLQDELFATGDLDDPGVQKQLALFIRYQTTNQRAFHRCLNDLLKLQKQRATEERGFESQKQKQAAEQRRIDADHRAQQLHELNKVLAQLRIDTEDTRKFNLDFDRMRAAGATELAAVSKAAVAAA